jgi:dimethylhistidine N-methyltransferase
MTATYRILESSDIKDQIKPHQLFALDVLVGLSSHPKRIASRYFYDDAGSELFRKITDLPEYYLTAREAEIFETHKDELARLLSEGPFNFVELGPGDGRKTRILLDAMLRARLDFHYVPIDISESAIRGLTASLSGAFPALETRGLVSEYFAGIRWLLQIKGRHTLVLFSGSNIGNFSQPEASVFLRSLWNSLDDGDRVLIGFDLKKDIDLMLAAYNDRHGVTRAFNLNLLRRINRELGGTFDLDRFRFYSTYDVFSGSMNSYLVSLERQDVFVETIGQTFSFRPWEPIQTEYSYKYLESDIARLAAETGFRVERQFYDGKRHFTDSLWRVAKRTTP